MSTVEKTYEMQWDCEFCGVKHLLGLSQRFCPTCGGPQNPAKRYFPEESAKVAVEDHPFVGADVTCPACRHAMSRNCQNCSNCGSPMGGSTEVGNLGEQKQSAGGEWQGGGGAAPAPARKSKLPLILGLIVLAIIVFLVVRVTLTKGAVLTVARQSWSREIAVERFDEVEKTAGCSEVPSGARILSRSTPTPTCTTKRVDKGDGTFKETKQCTEPKEQCRFRADQWKQVSVAKETGQLGVTPAWPKLDLRLGTCRGCEREAAKTERYTVGFDAADGKAYDCEFGDENAWKRFAKGATFAGKIRVVGGGLDCDSLKAN